MKLKSLPILLGATTIALSSNVVLAHPGHEPEDLLHALAHELASPRGILALLILGVAGALWVAHKARTKK